MNREVSGVAAALSTVVTVILLFAGAAMWQNPPSAADAAVGKGLVALGTCAAVFALTFAGHWLSTPPRRVTTLDPGRDDWADA